MPPYIPPTYHLEYHRRVVEGIVGSIRIIGASPNSSVTTRESVMRRLSHIQRTTVRVLYAAP